MALRLRGQRALSDSQILQVRNDYWYRRKSYSWIMERYDIHSLGVVRKAVHGLGTYNIPDDIPPEVKENRVPEREYTALPSNHNERRKLKRSGL